MTTEEETVLRKFLAWLDENTTEFLGYVPLGTNDDVIDRFRAWLDADADDRDWRQVGL